MRAFSLIVAATLVALPGCFGDDARVTDGCTATMGSACNFACAAGDSLHVEVHGSGAVDGSASCGGVTAGCHGEGSCEDGDFPKVPASGEGTCNISKGTEAHCWAGE